MQPLPKILLIEDDKGIAVALAHALSNHYDVETASSGKQALYKADAGTYETIILDLNLPDLPGLAICQQLRERGITAPILILTGESRVLTKIHLLDAGANDYLTKPFSLGELKARLRNLAKYQALIPKANTLVSVGDLVLDRYKFQVSRGDLIIELRRNAKCW